MTDELEHAYDVANKLYDELQEHKKMTEPKELSPKLYKQLMDVNNKMISIQQMVQMFQAQAEARLMAVNEEKAKVWEQIKRETGADLENVIWEPHPTEPRIIPVQVNLRRGPGSRLE